MFRENIDYPWWATQWAERPEGDPKKIHSANDIYESTKYPAHLLPEVLRNVVVALTKDVDAPIELISGSVLSAVSLACQGFVDVQFPDGRTKPCSLYNLVLADSGERKSTIHALVMKPFLDFEKKDKTAWDRAYANYNADMLIWDAQNKTLLRKINQKINKGESFQTERSQLAHLSTQKPKPPKRIKFIYTDTTPEAMQRGLYDNIPSAGYISAEASMFFEGRAKNNLGFLNELWDGAPVDVERRSKESFSVLNARFSMLLLVQNDIFIQYFKKYGRKATGSGFLSRFLISAVERGQFRRLSSNYDINSQELAIFHKRINELLLPMKEQYEYKPSKIDECIFKTDEEDEIYEEDNISDDINTRELKPKILTLSRHSQRELERFYGEIEKAAYYFSNNQTIKAWILKLAENTIRIAGLLQYFTDSNKNEISDDMFECALKIAKYYANNTIHLFLTTFASSEQDAENVYTWLKNILPPPDLFEGMFDDVKQKLSDEESKIQYIKRVDIQRRINKIYLRKDGARLNAALKRLEEEDRIWIDKQRNANGSVTEKIYLKQ
ncbi:DUF3987 domain-containing protein [Salmonella enterica subsp. enterica serovar Ouagadougou]|uniref:DUF3987 domain-containing protein n=1 Tax=Salmonella enterica subsp. enterica serovar Ouagadougou TaxID=2564899 RepID=A0A5I0D6L3_SALET|nr:DUF3987 domain-containing protein [Salmonella enterica subsp. enterica serovar Ouagadougou]EDU0977643.1 DUF3987 domain-containing protein [Salmonella enterica subsp. enterica serovar Anderlecht]EBR9511309.1 DUF3987 domain-containing protein [Salmonella enterica subsp. enterica serovar Ouagadougou]EBV0635971.1 DUF3987 domain-containing protein [Salmonella enterica subsp. enterica serovar Ouagadougou]EBV0754583.1 DUF3987 domain-containing protein [Salmonella enterica subsp. enterica serovar Ou